LKDINLLPKYYILEKQNKAKRYKITMTLIIALTLLSASIAYPLLVKYSLILQRDTILTQIKVSNNYVEAEKQFSLIKGLYNNRMETGDSLRQKGINLLVIFDKLEKALPENFYIVSIALSESENAAVKITLEGISSSSEGVATFVKNIRSDEYFGNVSLSSLLKSGSFNAANDSQSPSNVQYAFNMNIMLEGKK